MLHWYNKEVTLFCTVSNRLTCYRWMPISRDFKPHQRLSLFEQERLHSFLVLVGSRNGSELDLQNHKVSQSYLNKLV